MYPNSSTHSSTMLKGARPPAPLSETRPWGRWTVLHESEGLKLKLIEVEPGHRLSLQYHHYRSEFWVCMAGRAVALIGDRMHELKPFDTAVIPAGMLHRLGNPGAEPLSILELQEGQVLSEEDIVRLEDDYHRVAADSL